MTTSTTSDHDGHRPQRGVVADPRQERGAEEEPDTLERVLRAGQDRHQPEQCTVAGDELDGALRAHLGEVLGDPGERLESHHEHDPRPLDPARVEEREPDERHDLQAEPGEQRAVQAASRADPAADQVGDDPHELVQEEQERDRDRGVAEFVEVQQHEHPERAVGERERPVAGGDQGVVAELHRTRSITFGTPARRRPWLRGRPCGRRSRTRCRTRSGP